MLNDNLTNNSCNNQSQLEDKVDRLEKVIEGYDQRFNTQDLHTQKLTANTANIANVEAAGIKSDNVDAGALTADSAVVTGSIKAKSFKVEDPVIVNGVTTPTANVGTLDATDINAVNGKITNLTVDNLMTGPDSSLEYKNLSVTNQATINKLNLVDPHVAEVIADNAKVVDFETQNIKMLSDGKITRLDNNANVVSYVDGATILGDLNNDVNITGKSRPKWNDASLATLADIQQGAVKPVYRGTVVNYNELPPAGNAKGDLYIVKELAIADKVGIGHAQWNGESWDPSLIYELELFETKEEAAAAVAALEAKIKKNAQDINKNAQDIAANTQAIEDEMVDAVNRETAIVDGVAGSQVKKVAENAVMAKSTGDEILATVDGTVENAKHIENIRNIEKNESLNDITAPGKYIIRYENTSTILNGPDWLTKISGYATLIVLGWNGADKQQILIGGNKNGNISLRYNDNGGATDKWQPWKDVANMDEVFVLKPKKRITSDSDLNDFHADKVGVYIINPYSSLPANMPVSDDIANFGRLTVYAYEEMVEIYQKYEDISGISFERAYTLSKGWTKWNKVTKDNQNYKSIENKYYEDETGNILGNYGIDMNNSDIINANSIYFGDACDSATSNEGIHFKRNDGDNAYDTFYMYNGLPYMVNYRKMNSGFEAAAGYKQFLVTESMLCAVPIVSRTRNFDFNTWNTYGKFGHEENWTDVENMADYDSRGTFKISGTVSDRRGMRAHIVGEILRREGNKIIGKSLFVYFE